MGKCHSPWSTASATVSDTMQWCLYVSNTSLVEESVERVLVVRARMARNLNAASLVAGILKEIDVRTLVEPMMAGLRVRRCIKVVDIPKTDKIIH